MMRIGHGYDLHALAPGRPLVVGGVTIPHERGPVAHSDGDVLVHALCDALLGAAALGDLGRHFPDTDPAWRDVASRVLLRRVVAMLRGAGWRVLNVDTTVLAERPRMAPHCETMRARLAADLEVEMGQVSVKATTAEGLDAIGREEAIAAHAVCLIGPLQDGARSRTRTAP